MDVYFQSEIGACTEFMQDGKKQKVSIVISPLKTHGDEMTLKITYGCNLWRSCENKGCFFSLKARDLPKTKAKLKG